MFFVGIDWSEKYLDYCITNNSGDVILRHRVENNDDGFNAMLQSFAKETIDLSIVSVAIESPHQRVVDFLLARGICIYPVNPKEIGFAFFFRQFMTTEKAGNLQEVSQTRLMPNCLLIIFASTYHILEPGAYRSLNYDN